MWVSVSVCGLREGIKVCPCGQSYKWPRSVWFCNVDCVGICAKLQSTQRAQRKMEGGMGYSSSKVPHQVKRRRRRDEGGCLLVRLRSGRMAVGVFECLFFWCGESMAIFPLRRLEKRVCEWIFGSNLLCGPTRVSLPGVGSGLLHPLSSPPLPRAVSRIDHKFHLLHSKRAVVRCYVCLVWRKANSARSRLGRCREIL